MVGGRGLDGIMACGTPSADRPPDGRLQEPADGALLPFSLAPFSLPLGDESWCACAAAAGGRNSDDDRLRRVAISVGSWTCGLLDLDVVLVVVGYFGGFFLSWVAS